MNDGRLGHRGCDERPGSAGDADGRLLIAAPMGFEALLIGSATRTAQVRRTGIGYERSLAAARELREHHAAAVLVMGFCGGLDESSRPGDVIVCDRLLRNAFDRDGRRAKASACAGADVLAATLTDCGLRVRRGMVLSVAGSRPVHDLSRAEFRETGAIAVDLESGWLARGLGTRPFGAVRVVVDTPTRGLTRPLATFTGGIRAALVLRRVARAVDELVGECGVHTVFGIAPS